MKLFANLTGLLGQFFAKTTSGACWGGYIEEEKMPESLLK